MPTIPPINGSTFERVILVLPLVPFEVVGGGFDRIGLPDLPDALEWLFCLRMDQEAALV